MILQKNVLVVSARRIDKMTVNEKVYFIYGYCYGLATEAKSEGLFSDLSLKAVANFFLQEYLEKHKGGD